MSYWLFVPTTALLLYYLKFPILIIAGVVFACVGLVWLCERFPRTMVFFTALVRGLMGR